METDHVKCMIYLKSYYSLLFIKWKMRVHHSNWNGAGRLAVLHFSLLGFLPYFYCNLHVSTRKSYAKQREGSWHVQTKCIFHGPDDKRSAIRPFHASIFHANCLFHGWIKTHYSALLSQHACCFPQHCCCSGICFEANNLHTYAHPFLLNLPWIWQIWQGLGLAIGASLMDIKKATTLASVTVMTFMLAGGFFVKVNTNFQTK